MFTLKIKQERRSRGDILQKRFSLFPLLLLDLGAKQRDSVRGPTSRC
jgi:hypothetical protein